MWNVTPSSYTWAAESDIFPKSKCTEKEEEEHFYGEKPDKQYFSLLAKVNITSCRSCWQHASLIQDDETGTLPLWLSS